MQTDSQFQYLENLDDPRTQEICLNPFTLSFQGPCQELEAGFLTTSNQANLTHIRLSLILGILFYAAFGFLDSALIPDQKTVLWLIRYVVVCPAVLLGIALTFIPALKQHIQYILLILMILAGAGISIMVAVAQPPANYSYYAGLILVFMMSYGFIKARFVWASTAGWINVLLYEIIAIWFVQTPPMILLNNNFFFISANLIGMATCYSIELSARKEYFTNLQLTIEQVKTVSLNRDLEKRVRQRTAALSDNNQQLELEIEAHHRERNEKEILQRQLAQTHKMESIGTLAGGIAHDFNNILSSVIGFTELTLDEVEKGSQTEENLQEVYQAGLRAKDLIQQILAFARQSDESMKPLHVRPIVKEVLKLIRSTIPTTITIDSDLRGDSLILGNATQIHQVVMNLCTNAAHAMAEEGGNLRVTMTEHADDVPPRNEEEEPGINGYIELRISDTGTGIPADIIASIFDPYFTTKPPGEGTGMGLAMVHGIIESHGGTISVESAPGAGTQFFVTLPICSETVEHTPYETEPLPTGSEHILVVDDEAQIARMTSLMFTGLGYKVTTRVSSVEALELFCSRSADFDAVVTDMTMPNMTGERLAREIKSVRPDIPIILCTGFSEKIKANSDSEFIDGFLMKPSDKAHLARAIRQVLDEARSGKTQSDSHDGKVNTFVQA